jgi:two-component system cell cycle response regulator DivK
VIRILLVEDNELNRDMLSRRLQRKGYLVVTANDGNAALNLMREEQPAIVLLDMNLPIKDGWSVLDEAKEDPTIAHIPIIALTAHAMEEDRQRARVAGCNDYETKPIDLPLLLAKINKLTNNNAY